MSEIKKYVFNRLKERSSWVGIGLAITSAAALPAPWNYFSFVAGTLGSLVPDGKVDIAK